MNADSLSQLEGTFLAHFMILWLFQPFRSFFHHDVPWVLSAKAASVGDGQLTGNFSLQFDQVSVILSLCEYNNNIECS